MGFGLSTQLPNPQLGGPGQGLLPLAFDEPTLVTAKAAASRVTPDRSYKVLLFGPGVSSPLPPSHVLRDGAPGSSIAELLASS